jgi:hypothetical protein
MVLCHATLPTGEDLHAWPETLYLVVKRCFSRTPSWLRPAVFQCPLVVQRRSEQHWLFYDWYFLRKMVESNNHDVIIRKCSSRAFQWMVMSVTANQYSEIDISLLTDHYLIFAISLFIDDVINSRCVRILAREGMCHSERYHASWMSHILYSFILLYVSVFHVFLLKNLSSPIIISHSWGFFPLLWIYSKT